MTRRSSFVVARTRLVARHDRLFGKISACVYSTGIVGNNYRVIVYDPTGRTVCEVDVSGKLAALSHDDTGDYIFVLAGSDVTRINLVNRKVGTIDVGSGGFDILVQDPSSFLVAMSNYALTCTPPTSPSITSIRTIPTTTRLMKPPQSPPPPSRRTILQHRTIIRRPTKLQ